MGVRGGYEVDARERRVREAREGAVGAEEARERRARSKRSSGAEELALVVSEEGRGDGARDELGAGGRDKSVLRIFYCSYLVVDVFRECKCGKRGMSSVQQSRA